MFPQKKLFSWALNQWASCILAKQEQQKRWRAKRTLVRVSKHQRHFCESGDSSPEEIWDCIMQNPAIQCIFGRKMVRNAVHNAFLNTNNGNGVPTRYPSKWPPMWTSSRAAPCTLSVLCRVCLSELTVIIISILLKSVGFSLLQMRTINHKLEFSVYWSLCITAKKRRNSSRSDIREKN